MGRDTDEEDDFISIPGEEDGEEAASEEEDPVQRLIVDKALKRDRAINQIAQGDGEEDGPCASLHGEEDADIQEGQAVEEEEVDEEEKEDEEEEEEPVVNLEGDEPLGKKRKKKKKKKKKAKSEGKDIVTSSSAPLPKAESKPLIGVVLVSDSKDIAREVEMHRLVRASSRYFDEESAVNPILSGRCFNCGKVGHRANACTFAARQKPCYLCSQFGHEARDCPAQLCFRCGLPGHKSRDCPNQAKSSSSWEMGCGRCLRCASPSCACANRADYFRYEGGCTESYLAADLARCKCYECGKYGHICCKKTPSLPARLTCYSCGSSSHVGEACPSESRPHLAAERSGDMKAAQAAREAEIERMNAAAASRNVGRFGGGGGRGGGGGGRPRYSDAFDSRQQYSGTGGGRGQDSVPYLQQYPGSMDRDRKRQRVEEPPQALRWAPQQHQRGGDGPNLYVNLGLTNQQQYGQQQYGGSPYQQHPPPMFGANPYLTTPARRY